jgi:hypothetical protein
LIISESENNGFAFFEVGKTGSSSIKKVLEPYGKLESHLSSPLLGFTEEERFVFQKHIPPAIALQRLGEERFDRLFRFAFVRNPFDRLVSRYFYSREAEADLARSLSSKKMSMKSVELLCRYPRLQLARKGIGTDKQTQYRGLTWLSQYTQAGFLSDEKGVLLVDFIGRFERLQEDFDYVCQYLGLPKSTLPRINRTNHDHYSTYFTNETREYVENIYKEDLERFGYAF